jgi:hypothetical protein
MADPMPTPAELVAALVARGIDLGEWKDDEALRYAAHEACHALQSGLEPPWTNKRVDDSMKRFRRGDRAFYEIMARAVEQIVCRELGHPCRDVEHWAFMAVKEAATFREAFFDFDQTVDMIKRAMTTLDAQIYSSRIIALARVGWRSKATPNANARAHYVDADGKTACSKGPDIEHWPQLLTLEGPWKARDVNDHLCAFCRKLRGGTCECGRCKASPRRAKAKVKSA